MFATPERILHSFKDGFHRLFGLGSGHAGSADHCVNYIQLNHKRLPGKGQPMLDRQVWVVKLRPLY